MRINKQVLSIGNRVLEGSHRAVLTLTRGRWPHKVGNTQFLELHTIGRKTGQRRSTLLSTPLMEGGKVILVASKGGYPEDPIWYKNLAANPDVEITIAGTTTPMRAHTATPEERAELWPRITKIAKNYAGYQKRTAREIPVVICEPR